MILLSEHWWYIILSGGSNKSRLPIHNRSPLVGFFLNSFLLDVEYMASCPRDTASPVWLLDQDRQQRMLLFPLVPGCLIPSQSSHRKHSI
jgi:hypothetical protein